jgi:hypothetical protein
MKDRLEACSLSWFFLEGQAEVAEVPRVLEQAKEPVQTQLLPVQSRQVEQSSSAASKMAGRKRSKPCAGFGAALTFAQAGY